jgi:hypothetical protein
MDTIQVNLNKAQFINILCYMDDADKLEVYKELKKSLFLNRFNSLLNRLKTDELSLDDISEEVKTVRRMRYENGKQVIQKIK